MFTSRCPSQCDNQSPKALVFFSWSKYHLRDVGQWDPPHTSSRFRFYKFYFPENKRRKKNLTRTRDFPSSSHPSEIIPPRHSRVVSALGFSTAFCAFPRVPNATLPSTEFEGRRSPVRSSRRAGEGGTTGATGREPSSSSASISMAHAGRVAQAMLGFSVYSAVIPRCQLAVSLGFLCQHVSVVLTHGCL